MKTIGRTNEGAFLVEMIEDEHTALVALQLAAEGKDFVNGFYGRGGLDRNLSATLRAIQEWILIKDRGNMLRSLADDLDRVIKSVEHAVNP